MESQSIRMKKLESRNSYDVRFISIVGAVLGLKSNLIVQQP